MYLDSSVIAVLTIQPQLAFKQKDMYYFLWSHTKLNVLHFRAFNNVVLIQSVGTNNVEEIFYFTAGSLCIKCLNLSRDSSMPR